MKTFLSLASLFLFSVMLIFCIGCFYSYFYPMHYKQEIAQISQENAVPPALVASIINVESGFNSDAVSNKGAVGLMQLMPETAKWVCQKSGIKFEQENLTDAQQNIAIGSKYLKMLLASFENQDAAICAYNAGPSKVKSWLADPENSTDGKSLQKIPYKETRQYLNKVKKNLRYYQQKY